MLFEYRRPTRSWVKFTVRHLRESGVTAEVSREGDDRRGAVMLKLKQRGEGCRVASQIRDANGDAGWLPGLGAELTTEAAVDAYIARSLERDPDLWVIEIEHESGANPIAAAFPEN